MKAAILKNDLVVNVSVWDDSSTEPEGFQVVLVEDSECVGPGFTYDGQKFIPPAGMEQEVGTE